VQTIALAHLAATEDVVAEDGTIEEEFRGLGHQRLDAPDLAAEVLGLTPCGATDRVATAVDLVTRHPKLVRAMASGRLDCYRAGIVAAELAEADPDVCTQVVDRLEDRLGSDTGGVLRARTRRLLAAVDPELLRRKAERARAERSLRRSAFGVGVDEWSAKLPVEQSRMAWSVVDGLARSYVKDGTSPGIEQARADALLDLVNGRATGQVSVHVTVPASQMARHGNGRDPATTESAGAASDPDAGDVAQATSNLGEDGEELVPVTGFGLSGVTHVRASWLGSLVGGTAGAASQVQASSASAVEVVACADATGAHLTTDQHRPATGGPAAGRANRASSC
jgi:hypothetical protein